MQFCKDFDVKICIFGMSSALETLCGQAYGAGQFKKLGSYTYGGIICLFMVCVPVSILWIFTEDLLVFLGQDRLIAHEAGKYAIWLIVTLFPYAILQSLVRFLQTQSLIFPMLLSSIAALSFHLPVCWVFIFKLKLGNAGAAISIGLSYWLNASFLMLYVKYSSTCRHTRISFSKDVFLTVGEFFRLAIASAAMVCIEWWSFELVLLLAGLLPNPQLESSVLCICSTTTSLHYQVTQSFGAAASTLVSNQLGAGNPKGAKVSLYAVIVPAASEFLSASAILFGCRYVLGYAFSNEAEVVSYVKDIAPVLCLSIIMDSIQAVLSGVARGSGWQHIGAYVNLGAYYLVGVPTALILGFALHLRGKGLWTGMVAGATVQSVSFSIITCLTDWEKQAMKARQRILEEEIPAGTVFLQ